MSPTRPAVAVPSYAELERADVHDARALLRGDDECHCPGCRKVALWRAATSALEPEERPCDLCGDTTLIELLENVDVFPLGQVCPACAVELRQDDDDSRTAEPECQCRGVCPVCTPGC